MFHDVYSTNGTRVQLPPTVLQTVTKTKRITLCNLTVTLSKDDLWSNVFWCAKHLHILELSTIFVDASFVQVCCH